MSEKKTDKVTLGFVAVLLAGAVVLGWQEVNAGILPEGSPAPPLSVERVDGSTASLESLRGKIVVVNFWATWCPPCREEMPYLLATVKELEPQGVTLVAISNDDVVGQREAVDRFLSAFPELRRFAAYGRPDVGHAWQVRALPSLYVLDREGKVLASHQGQASESQLRGWLDDALGHR
ncbi:MAG: TlpA family protein disulfide reductase [Myxococcota bacterium]